MPAGATVQRMAVFDTGQVRGQDLAFGTVTRGFARQSDLGKRLAGRHRGKIGFQVFLEESELVRMEPLGRGPKSPPL